MQSYHIKVSSSSPQAQFSLTATPRPMCTPDHSATHICHRLCPSLSLWPQSSSSMPPQACTGACVWWVSANLTHTQEAACSPYISDTEQADNYKTTLGAWLVLDITAVLLHAEWGKLACQPVPDLLWWVQMREGPGSLLGSAMGMIGATGCVETHRNTLNMWHDIFDLWAVRRSRSISDKTETFTSRCQPPHCDWATGLRHPGAWIRNRKYPQCTRWMLAAIGFSHTVQLFNDI